MKGDSSFTGGSELDFNQIHQIMYPMPKKCDSRKIRSNKSCVKPMAGSRHIICDRFSSKLAMAMYGNVVCAGAGLWLAQNSLYYFFSVLSSKIDIKK